jgi:hypothetical protein
MLVRGLNQPEATILVALSGDSLLLHNDFVRPIARVRQNK